MSGNGEVTDAISVALLYGTFMMNDVKYHYCINDYRDND
jgi:hypothetical protein